MINVKTTLSFYKRLIAFVMSDTFLYISCFSYKSEFKYNKQKLIAKIVSLYHIIEKGLTMPNMREKFGQDVISDLIRLCEIYFSKYNDNENQVVFSIVLLYRYLNIHEQMNSRLDTDITERIRRLYIKIKDVNFPTDDLHKFITSESFFSKTQSKFPEFVKSRHSIRNYSNEDISIMEIEKALEIANNTPSSCNRQPVRVKVIQNKDIIKSILEIQHGNRGFGHLANKLIVIYADMRIYNNIVERNTVYIDSGMFAMNLILALHYGKIGICPLNASFTYSEEKKIHKLLNMNREDKISLIISCGKIPDSVTYASSPKSSYLEKIEVI